MPLRNKPEMGVLIDISSFSINDISPNNDGINDKSRGTLFFIKRSSNVDEVDLAILLKKDKIILLVI